MVYSVVSAQTALFEFMDRDTVLIGHGLNKDLRVLGMMHSRIIDSQILASSAIAKILGTLPPAPVRMGELCRNFLRVQLVGDHCVEAAFAARKLIFWILAEEEREQMGRIWGQAYRGQLRGWAEWVARRIARARCEVGHGNRDLQH
ncbi:hypothetical protein BJX61DRAFT_518963 [Aspergillus egyptiacus]|nr:hypothetical protein BJX61DRAFT_518963 [Aspergillus egyptiacus]